MFVWLMLREVNRKYQKDDCMLSVGYNLGLFSQVEAVCWLEQLMPYPLGSVFLDLSVHG